MAPETKIEINELSFHYGRQCVLDRISARFAANAVTAVVGPSGQGKSTLLMTLNRLWQENGRGSLSGEVKIRLANRIIDVYRDDGYDLPWLRRRVALVFQHPNPLPMSIYKNAAFGLKLAGQIPKARMEEKVAVALQQAFLWDEVKDRLHTDARTLSGGQQQRLCIARSLVLDPEILLLDEPTSSLDSRASEVIETLLLQLKQTCTIIMVSHYLDQVRRVADAVLTMENGRLI